jgi:uncharacterized membrane protein
MPLCTNCNHELTESELQCPACGQPTGFSLPLAEPSSGQTPAELPLAEFFKAGWGLFTQYPVGFVGFCLLYLVIQTALQAVPYVGAVAAFAVSTPLLLGNFIVSAKLLQGQTPEFQDFFSGFQFFLPLLLLSLVAGLFIGIGILLLIIPGVYLIVAYMFASYLVVDRGLDFWPAMELSRCTVTPRWFSYFVFVLLVLVLNLAGAVALGVGLLVTLPLSFCTMTVAYAKIFGVRANYSGGGARPTIGG